MEKNSKAKKEEKERVQKIMSNNGYCSRRKAETLIEEGRVKVNEQVISLGDKAKTDDKITVDDEPLEKKKQVYILFNKPVKCVTSLSDPHNETIMKYIDVKERVFPVGRLDYYTSGLLILTNDGDFANKVMHPGFETVKTYRVRLQQNFKKNDLEKLKKGIELEDGLAKADKIFAKENVVDIQLHEGKNRIVRRMFKALGYSVYSLHRKAIGKLTLGTLKQGEYKKVSKKVINRALERPYNKEKRDTLFKGKVIPKNSQGNRKRK